MKAFYRHFLYEKLVWADITLNVWLLNGNAHETISQRAAWSRNRGKRWGCILCGLLDKIDAGHCDRSIANVNRSGNQEA